MVNVIKVETKAQLKTFIDLPHKLYEGDPNYVPELFVSQEEMLNSKKHPFHKHSKAEYFIAYKNNAAVGRIAAIRNNNHNAFNSTNDAFFGFFDTVNDFNVATALVSTVIDWAKVEGLSNLIGPANFSTNETCGMLIEGYDLPPVVMMPYNKEYYNQLITLCGFTKKTDLIAYMVESASLSEKSVSLMDAMERRLKQKNITIREIDHKNFAAEAANIKDVYNAAWNRNLGFVPMTDEEFAHLANELKMVYDPELCFVAEHEGKMVGFALALPDVNQAFIKMKRGRLLPFGLLKLLYYKRKINTIRVVTLGVVEGYRKMGIESCIYARTIVTGRRKGIVRAEASWILENNTLMNQALVNLKSDPYKKYRIYELPI